MPSLKIQANADKLKMQIICHELYGGVSVVYKLKCSDLGMNCSWEGSGNTVEELMMKGAQHAKAAHNMSSMSPDLVAKAKAAVKQV